MKNTPYRPCGCVYSLCMGSVALVFIVLGIQCVGVSQLLFSRWYIVGPSRESVNAVDHLLAFFFFFKSLHLS